MKKMIMLLAIAAFGFPTAAHADLLNRGYDTMGNRLIYDTDLNITWYDYTNDLGNWYNQKVWATNLSVTVGTHTFNDWRLPKTVDGPYSHGYDGTTTGGHNITNSEMGHLYYSELGNISIYATDGSLQPWPVEWGLRNTGKFLNLRDDWYWSDTTYSGYSDYAWRFDTKTGLQALRDKVAGSSYAMAVRKGDVLGTSPLAPIMPQLNGSAWKFKFGVGVGQQCFIDPVVAVGYDYVINSGPLFESVLLPNIGDGLFELWLYDQDLGDYYLYDQLAQEGIVYLFGTGVDRFRIKGIETTAGIDPNNPNAFVTGLTFTEDGIVDMSMIPLTENTDPAPVPEPATWMLLGSGLAGLMAFRRKFARN